jgi:LysM repeat protein
MVLFLAGAAVLCSGCETFSGRQRRQSETRLYNEIANLKARVQRIEMRLDGMEAGREDIYEQIGDLRANQDRALASHRKSLDALESNIAAQEAARGKLRAGMVEELSGKMAEIIRKQTPSAPPIRTELGYEHVVKSGETLSEIAQAYGVNVGAITKANNLQNPDDLRVGQKLFIPE